MPHHAPQRPQTRTPVSFAQRHAFLAGGLTVIGLLALSLVFGWMAFFERSEVRQREHLAGLLAEEADAGFPLEALPVAEAQASETDTSVRRALPKGMPDDGAQPIPWQPVALSGPELQAAERTLAAFWSAATWREKAASVRDAQRVGPLMQDYYEARRQREPQAGAFQSASAYRAGPFEILHLAYASRDDDEHGPLELALVKAGDGDFKLDWESYAAEGAMSWENLRKTRPASPTLMRAFVARSDRRFPEFPDPRFVCFRLVSRDFKHAIYACAEKESPVAHAVPDDTAPGSLRPMTVRVAFPDNTRSSDCARLVEIVAPRWLLLDER